MVKKGNFNRAPLGCFFKIYRYWYTDLLFEVKFDIVGEHLPDDSDKFAGTMPKCIVMRPAFSPLGITISLEGCVVRNNATFKAEYDAKRAEGRSHYNALGHCAGKLVRVIWKMLTDEVEFNLE